MVDMQERYDSAVQRGDIEALNLLQDRERREAGITPLSPDFLERCGKHIEELEKHLLEATDYKEVEMLKDQIISYKVNLQLLLDFRLCKLLKHAYINAYGSTIAIGHLTNVEKAHYAGVLEKVREMKEAMYKTLESKTQVEPK